MPADEFSFDITPQDAIDYLKKRRKTELSWHWSDVQKQEHMRAFTVAKMTSATLLDDVRKSLDKAMAEGQSFQEWRKDIIPRLQGVWLGKTYGDLWDGMTPAEQAGKTPPTPEERDRVIKAGRLETIFRTNMFNAYAAGRYRQLKEDADIYPYWRYVTAKDSAVRPAHRALEGKVFKADDPFWSTHYPPNGFNCRCIVEAVDEYDLEMQDLKVQEGGNTYFDEESGQTVYRDAEGKEYPCDKGWDYNVGEDTTGKKTLASKKFPPELTKAVREDLKAEAERLKAEAEELEKARKQAEEESRRADAAQKAAAEAKKQAEAEAKRKAEEQRKAQAEAERKAEEQRKAQAEAERKAKEQSKKAETEQKRFVVDVTRPSKPSKHPAKKAAAEEQKRFVVDVTRPDKPSKRPAKKAATEEQKRFVVDVTRPDKPSKRPGKKAAADEQKRFVVDVTRPDKPSKRPGKKAAADEQKRFVVDVTRPDKPSEQPGKKSLEDFINSNPLQRLKKLRNLPEGAQNSSSNGKYWEKDPAYRKISEKQILDYYKTNYKEPDYDDVRTLRTYVEGVPPVRDPNNSRLSSYDAVQKVMRTPADRKYAMETPLEELKKRHNSPKTVARLLYEALNEYEVPEGITLFRNSSLLDLLDHFDNKTNGRKYISMIESALKTGIEDSLKKQLNAINLDIASGGMFSGSIPCSSFVSTSISASNNFKEMDNSINVLNVIRVGKNVKGTYTSFILGRNKFSYQKEVIINANVKKKLLSANYINGQIVLEWLYGDE